jgi:hypothetical protein
VNKLDKRNEKKKERREGIYVEPYSHSGSHEEGEDDNKKQKKQKRGRSQPKKENTKLLNGKKVLLPPKAEFHYPLPRWVPHHL